MFNHTNLNQIFHETFNREIFNQANLNHEIFNHEIEDFGHMIYWIHSLSQSIKLTWSIQSFQNSNKPIQIDLINQ